jgi:hypothetical protein
MTKDKKKDENQYSVKDKSTGSFQLQSMLEYAESLGRMTEMEDNERKVLKGVDFLQKYDRNVYCLVTTQNVTSRGSITQKERQSNN